MKNVLFITKQFSPDIGGGIRRIEAVYRILRKNPSIKLEVVTAAKPDPSKYPGVRHIKQFFFSDSLKGNKVGYNFQKAQLKIVDKALLGWLPNVFWNIIFVRYDIVFTTTPNFANVLIAFIYKFIRMGKPYLVVEYRDMYSFDPEIAESRGKRIVQRIERFILQNCDKVIVTTQGMKTVLSRYVQEKKISIIRNFISQEDANAIAKLPKLNFDEKYFHIGYVGTLNTGRNPGRFLGLIKSVYDKKPIILHFVGTSTIEEDAIRDLCKEQKYDLNSLVFHGKVDRMTSLQFMKSFNGLVLIINNRAQISRGYGIPGKLYDYSFVNGRIICDSETLSNLQSDIEIEECGKLSDYCIFRLCDNVFLDQPLDNLVNEIINL